MKKSRKLLALVLAMMMAFSLMATASAAYEEEHVHDGTCCEATVQPRTQVIPCPRCGGTCRVWVTSDGLRNYDCLSCGQSWKD